MEPVIILKAKKRMRNFRMVNKMKRNSPTKISMKKVTTIKMD